MKPADRRIFVKEDDQPKTTDTGIILAAKLQKKQFQGTVVMIGDNIDEVEVGDRVVFTKSKDMVKVDGVELHSVFLNPSHIVKI